MQCQGCNILCDWLDMIKAAYKFTFFDMLLYISDTKIFWIFISETKKKKDEQKP